MDICSSTYRHECVAYFHKVLLQEYCSSGLKIANTSMTTAQKGEYEKYVLHAFFFARSIHLYR